MPHAQNRFLYLYNSFNSSLLMIVTQKSSLNEFTITRKTSRKNFKLNLSQGFSHKNLFIMVY